MLGEPLALRAGRCRWRRRAAGTAGEKGRLNFLSMQSVPACSTVVPHLVCRLGVEINHRIQPFNRSHPNIVGALPGVKTPDFEQTLAVIFRNIEIAHGEGRTKELIELGDASLFQALNHALIGQCNLLRGGPPSVACVPPWPRESYLKCGSHLATPALGGPTSSYHSQCR